MKRRRADISGLRMSWTRSSFNFPRDSALGSQRRFGDLHPSRSILCFGPSPSRLSCGALSHRLGRATLRDHTQALLTATLGRILLAYLKEE